MAAPFQQGRTAYQDFRARLSPTALRNPVGAAFEAAFGSVEDKALDQVAQSVKARMPGVAAGDALQWTGADRQIDRGPTETDAAYAARLQGAFETWPWAGTPRGLLRALYDAGYPNVALVQQLGGIYTLDANQNIAVVVSPRFLLDDKTPGVAPVLWTLSTSLPANTLVVPSPANGFFYGTTNPITTGSSQPTWPTTVGATVTDGTGTWSCRGRDFWSRFGLVFFPSFPTSWGGTPPANGTDEVERIRRIVRLWKAAHATCVTIVAVPGALLWDYPNPAAKTWDVQGRGTWDTSTTPAPTYWTP